ncbi:hypothetical protein NQ314_002490 [Rhamnusium bicolor]|uniref:PiggyBac transposable element-derived protein domain-containing protein n=1 Tax=Rhamnusium bicolor TaxID=1586634 RepID=A0AAV8ZQ28_9CUCU|nr:hypothetical protein NQ314_002490 [Rhamnusium bicolor]
MYYFCLHHDDSIDSQTGKLEIIMMYNSTKGGVDVVIKLCATHNTAQSTRRWLKVIFYTSSVLNVAAINAFVVYVGNNSSSNIRRSQFLEELALSLLDDHLQRRSTNQHLPKLIRQRIKRTSEPT